jgi:hypothetical protein
MPRPISATQLRLLQLMDGRRTLAELSAAVGTPLEHAARQLRELARWKIAF